MDNNDKQPIRLDPEKFGVPPRKGDPMGMIEMVLNMYRKMVKGSTRHPLWLKICIIVFSLIVLCIPGAFFLVIAFVSDFHLDTGLKVDSNSIQVFIPLLIGFSLLGVGIKIIYSNIKKMRKSNQDN